MLDRLKHIASLFRKKRHGAFFKPPAETKFVVVDTELTGLDEKKDAILSIGAVRMTGGVIDLGDTFYQLVNPEKKISAASVIIHEITPSEVAEKPLIDAVLAEFVDFISDDVLVGHFISLDLAFINREMIRTVRKELTNPVLDTCSLHDWLARRFKNSARFAASPSGYRLYDIAKRFDIPVSKVHNAIADAYTTAQLFQRVLPLLAEAGADTMELLLKIGDPFKGNDLSGSSSEISNL
jgi:DNA polymerase-3 subunit epsilon